MSDHLVDLHISGPFADPFSHFLSHKVFKPDVSQRILAWLENTSRWKLVETNFYEQFEFSLLDCCPPKGLGLLRSPFFLRSLGNRLEKLFNTSLDEHPHITAHKLVPGQSIRLHNDFIPGGETHRVLIQLNGGWKTAQGGLLVFFGSDCSEDVRKIFHPRHNSAIGFAISERSYHAVSTIHTGERFTLVYSFSERLAGA